MKLVYVGMALLAPATGVVVAGSPALAAVAFVPFLLVGMVVSPRLRLVAVLAGALIVFQASSDVGPLKLAYLGVLAIAVVLAAQEVPPGIAGSLRTYTVVLAVLLGGLTAMSVVRGNDAELTIRDATPYLMLVAATPLALAGGVRCSARTIQRLAIVFGVTAWLAWSVEFGVRRGLIDIPSVLLPSATLGALSIALASALAVTHRRSARWWMMVAVLIAVGTASGTRNALLALVIPALILSWVTLRPGSVSRRRAGHAIRSAAVAAPFAAVLSVAVVVAGGFDIGGAAARLTLLGTNSDDPSLVERRIQQDLAWQEIAEAPLIGTGPGTMRHVYRPTSDEYTEQFTLDTSLATPAKWGIPATLLILVLLYRWCRFIWPVRSDPTIWGLAFVGLLPWFLAQSLLGSTLEDKGLPLALVLLGAGTLAERRALAWRKTYSTVASRVIQ